jgi:hypothetical protein
MISLNGSIQRKFFFPADLLTTLIYFSDLSRAVFLLPHISLDEPYTNNKVRIRYQTVELGAYTINIFCDLALEVDVDQSTIKVFPLRGYEEVQSVATLNATTGYGYYSSTAKLFPQEGGTGIDYQLKFESNLPRPRGLRMMPKRVVDRIAHSISIGRVEEIADGFMQNALEAFDEWVVKQDHNLVEQWLSAREQILVEPGQPPKRR